MTPPRGIIENTAGAVRAAIAGGYGIEVDLQISADGEAMVHHDAVLGRLTEGDDRLDRMSAAALKRVAFRDSDERMMTLGELCDLVGGRVAAAARTEEPLRRRSAACRCGSRPCSPAIAARRRRCRSIRRSSRCCGKRPLTCRAALSRRNTGRIPIGIRCRHGCVTAWALCCPPP